MAVHKTLCSSPMKVISLQLRCWIKHCFCHRLWHFSPNAIQSCSSRIHHGTYSSIHHGVPYKKGRQVSGQCKEVQLHNDNLDSRLSQISYHLNISQSSAGSDSQKSSKEENERLAGDERICPKCVMNVTDGTPKGYEVMRNGDDMKSTSLESEASYPSSTQHNKAKPPRLLNIYTDASGRYGLGCVWDKKWIVSPWEDEWLSNNYRCMELLEMKAVLVAILTWGHNWTGSIVRIHCDNKMVVEYFNHRTRLNSKVAKAYKAIKLAAAEFNFELVVEQANKSHVQFQGTDSLSRLDFCRFHKLLPNMNSVPDLPPGDLEFLLPDIWENICVSVKLRSQNRLIGFR